MPAFPLFPKFLIWSPSNYQTRRTESQALSSVSCYFLLYEYKYSPHDQTKLDVKFKPCGMYCWPSGSSRRLEVLQRLQLSRLSNCFLMSERLLPRLRSQAELHIIWTAVAVIQESSLVWRDATSLARKLLARYSVTPRKNWIFSNTVVRTASLANPNPCPSLTKR